MTLGNFHFSSLPSGYILQVDPTNLLLVSSAAAVGPAVWQSQSSSPGSWTNAANWSNVTVPSGAGVTATVGSATATPAAITLDGPQTLGQLTLAATAAASGYTLQAGNGGSLTMSNTGGAVAQILVSGGSQNISAP